MRATIVIYALISLAVITFFWEHYARQKNNSFKPSVFINWSAKRCQSFFETIGIWWAKISSFYTYIDLKEIKQTFHDLLKPTIDLGASWLWAFKGYFSTVNLYEHPYLVILGSVTLILIILSGMSYLFPTSKYLSWFIYCYKSFS